MKTTIQKADTRAFVPFDLIVRFETMAEATKLRNELGNLSGSAGEATYPLFDVLDDEVLAQGGPECPE